MTIRRADFADIPRLVEIMRDAHARSVYADVATFDVLGAMKMCRQSIQRHGHRNYGGTLFLVSETAGEVRGFIIGMLDLVYPCVHELVATDLLFLFAENAARADAAPIVRQVIEWAESNPKVIEIHLGVTDAVGDWKRVGRLYERLGLEQCGGMYRRIFTRAAQRAEVAA